MDLIEIYIQEVTRRLPEKMRHDIALELRSTIEDMLPDDYTNEEVKTALSKLGHPALLASGFTDRPMYLIGPRYFDVYVTLLKMLFPIAAVVSFISMMAEYVIGYNGDEAIMNLVLSILGEGVTRILEVGVQVFFWLTLVFAFIERTDKGKDLQPLSTSLKKWTPEDLKNIPYIPKKKAIPRYEVFFSLLWTAVWATVYFYANHLVGVYKGDGDKLNFVLPALNQDILFNYLPIVLIAITLEVALAFYKSMKKQWTKHVAILNTIKEIYGTIALIIIISNANLFNPKFITYMADLFSVTSIQFQLSIVGSGIAIFVLAAGFNIVDGFRKSRVH